jgi:hypothetical protein
VSSRSIDLRENMLGKEAMKDAQLGLWLADEQRAGLGRVADAVERSARDARSDPNTPKLWPKGTVKMSSAGIVSVCRRFAGRFGPVRFGFGRLYIVSAQNMRAREQRSADSYFN